MLVLTRKVGERVLIGDDIELVVMDVKGDSIRLGISAPRSTRIQRGELVDAVKAENVTAAHATPEDAQALLAALSARSGARIAA